MPVRPHTGTVALGRSPALDGVRGLAVVAVLLFHSDFAFASGGFLGVSVFFTISGFLITTLLIEEHARTGAIDLGAFANRRARRLFPAAWACLAGVILAAPFWSDEQIARLPGDVAAAFGNVTNWRAAGGSASYLDLFDSSPSPLAHFWSLAIEMQFYVALPLVAVVALRTGGRKHLMVAIIALLAVSQTAMVLADDFDLAYNGTHTRAVELLLGSAFAVAAFRRRRRLRPLTPLVATVLGIAALAGLGVLTVITSITSPWLIRGGLIGVSLLSCAVVIAATTAGPVATVLGHPALVALGKISYGVYLAHWPIFLILTPERIGIGGVALFALRCAVTAAIAAASYHLLETPIRRERRIAAARPATLAALTSAGLLIVGTITLPTAAPDDTTSLLALGDGGVVRFDETAADPDAPIDLAAQPAADASGPRQRSEQLDQPAASDKLTTTPRPEYDLTPPPQPPRPPRPTRVAVIGSDRAALDAIAKLSDDQPIEVIDVVRPDCSFAEAVEVKLADGSFVDVSDCAPVADAIASAVSGRPIDLVVVAAGAIDNGVVRRADEVGFPTDLQLDAVAARSAATRGAVDELLAPFDDAGIPILMSWWGEPGLLDLELGRISTQRTSVVGLARSADALRTLIEREIATDADVAETARVMVVGDSTSLVLARALHDDDRLDVLWAGENGCPIVRATHLHGDRGLPPRALDCPDFTEKLPPLLDEFDPDVVIVMPGAIALASLTFGDLRGVHPPGSKEWFRRHDADFAVLMELLRPADGTRSPSVLVADSPSLGLGPFSTREMLQPERLIALNGQIERWTQQYERVTMLDYAGPLERYEAEFGSIRPDFVHPAAIELAEIASAHYTLDVIDAAGQSPTTD